MMPVEEAESKLFEKGENNGGRHQLHQLKMSPTPSIGQSNERALSPSPAGGAGRIKAPPICSAPSLQKEAMSSNDLSKMCFAPGDISISLSGVEILPSSCPMGVISSTSSTTSTTSSTHQADVASGNTAMSSDSPTKVIGKSPVGTPRPRTNSTLNAKIMTRKISRQGRSTQRWVTDTQTNQLVRLVTGCVPILKDGRILFVSASRKQEWILPKGGWEIDETMEESALRETFEEAGVLGKIGPKLSEIEYETRKARKRRKEREEVLKKKQQRVEGDASSACSAVLHSSEDEQVSQAIDIAADACPNGTTTAVNAADESARVKIDERKDMELANNDSTRRTSNGRSTEYALSALDRIGNDLKSETLTDPAVHGGDDTASVASVASVASDGSASYNLVRMSLFPLYVMDVKEQWPESGRARKVVDIDEAIKMVSGRREFREALMEVKEKGLHLMATKNELQIRA